MRKAPAYLTKFPISIRKKQHSRVSEKSGKVTHFKSEHCTDFKTQYGYFDVNKAGNINFIITLNDRKRKVNYNIKIAKSHIYKSLLLTLMYRPVFTTPDQKKNFYVHKNIEPLMPIEAMNDLIPSEVKERYEKVKTGLITVISDESNEVRKRTAELQLERLLEQQWKMELLYELYESEKLVEKSIDESKKSRK